ncbi:MAG TPA: MFS transporter, partial [Acetobacteraceae bacterium]|nr:MFS transporter [Acetobacteraceae bacterium]
MTTSRTGVGLRPLLPLYLVIFIAFCGYSLMMTLFVPMLMGQYGFVPAATGIGQRTTLIGLLLAIYPLGQFLGAPAIGALSDRFGRKPVLVVSLAISVGAYAVVSLGIEVRSLLVIGAGCLIGGLAESNIAIVQSAVADVTSAEDRPRLFAWIYSASSVGYIAGPVGGGQLAEAVGWSAPFWLATGL